MKIIILLSCLIMLQSCAIIKWANTSAKTTSSELTESRSNKELWIGKVADDLVLHPIFATKEMNSRKASNGIEVITFKNSAGINGKNQMGTFGSSYSNSMEVACNHVFYLKEKIIYDYQRVGDCTVEEDPNYAPRN
ncbi:MAG: hypothetical protein K2P81_00685 [Bacteriovoracaceae bacterium]|nr:hypothetical protein [Bacteriovoracaceae bacterium]